VYKNGGLSLEQKSRLLQAILIGVCAIGALGSAALGYGAWSLGNANTATTAQFAEKRKRLTQLTTELRAKKHPAREKDPLRLETPGGAGSAVLAAEISQAAEEAHLALGNIRFGDGQESQTADPNAAQKSGGDNQGSDKPQAASDPNKKVDADGLKSSSFECTCSGDFQALQGFLEGMARTPRIIDMKTIELTRTGVDKQADSAQIAVRITGAYYGLPDQR